MEELVLSLMCVSVLSLMEESLVQMVKSFIALCSHCIISCFNFLVVCNNDFCANGGTCEVSFVGLTCR